MKTPTKLLVATLALSLSGWLASAQDQDAPRPRRGDRPPPGGPPEGPGGQGFAAPRPMLSPLIAALDANRDGVIDEQEIDNAPAALRKLDKNNDGKLTMDELRPRRPEGVGRPDAPERPRYEGGPREPRDPAGPRPPERPRRPQPPPGPGNP